MLVLAKAVMAIMLGFVFSVIFGYFALQWLRGQKVGQNVSKTLGKRHEVKQGTPTMGGVMFFFSLILGTLFLAGDSYFTYFLLACALGFGLIGFIDDYIKIVKKRSLGLTAKQKIIGQLVLSIVLSVVAVNVMQISTEVLLPIVGGSVEFGAMYIPFLIFLLVGTTNAVNLTDGLDGLASGVTLIVALGYTLIGVLQGQMAVIVFSAALAGSCLGFLVFNHHPAKVFMGDTGSLLLGGAVAALAIMTKTELLLPLIGIIYVSEVVSDIIQVGVYKWKKVRVFKMAPLHHHFELCGWSETKVVRVFWAVTAIAVLLTLLCYSMMMGNIRL
mgnify:CR=1 FL=1